MSDKSLSQAYDRPWLTEGEKKLVAALRSGKYEQTREVLRDSKGFCCLGVACDLSEVAEWEGEGEEPKLSLRYQYDGSPTCLSWQVSKWLGWGEDNPTGVTTIRNEVRECEAYHSLANLNDAGFSFEQIADVIEAGLIRKEGDERNGL